MHSIDWFETEASAISSVVASSGGSTGAMARKRSMSSLALLTPAEPANRPARSRSVHRSGSTPNLAHTRRSCSRTGVSSECAHRGGDSTSGASLLAATSIHVDVSRALSRASSGRDSVHFAASSQGMSPRIGLIGLMGPIGLIGLLLGI